MSNRNSRTPPSSNVPPTQSSSKLPKFLQKQANRDRSRSVTDPARSVTSLASGSSSSISPEVPPTPSASKPPRKSSKFLSINRDKDGKPRRPSDAPPPSEMGAVNNEMEEPPVIIEPVNIPRSRSRSDRPLSASEPAQHISLYSSSSSTSAISNFPTRLSGWFSQTFSTSSTDLSLPSLLSQAAANSSPKGKNPLLTAAKHGKGHLDKAMRYLLDSDSMPDKCTDPIWLLGVQHPGYEPPPFSAPMVMPTHSLSSSTRSRRDSGSFRSSASSISHLSTSSTAEQLSLSLSQSSVIPSSSKHVNPAANWPPAFYADFTSRVWLTYRSNFMPIRDTRLADLPQEASEVSSSPTTVRTKPWNWGGEKGWTSDSGWGCMLRTGQSLLASALVHLHLGREWRRPPYPVHTTDYATYVQILTWFFDSPSPEAPFSVHRMALAGKELGKDVGQWFGPSTAAGAIKTLLAGYPEAGLGVSVATDGVLFQTDVFAASNGRGISRSPKRQVGVAWGDRPVLLLIGVRLGIDGVNPIYYETIKLLYTFPQSVGIAGGRPSSSYYFVGSQSDNLFYLDPHHARPAIPLRPSPQEPTAYPSNRETTPESDQPRQPHSPTSASQHHRAQTSPSSVRTGSSTFSYHAPLSPSPLQKEFSTSSNTSSSSNNHQSSRSPPPSQQYHHPRWQSSSQPSSPTSEMDYRELSGFGLLDPLQEHYVTSYHAAELKTFHCERVRKMPLSGLDPSMLIGFLCKDEADWRDFRRRVVELPRTVFSIQDEPPTWPSDSDDNMGLESISEPDDAEVDDEGEEGEVGDEDGEGEQFFDTRSGSPSTSSAGASGSHHEAGRCERGNSEEVDTEEDPVDPITPGPNSRFSIRIPPEGKRDETVNEGGDFVLEDEDEPPFEGGDIEDDWVDPSISSPATARSSSIPVNDLPPPAVVHAAVSTPIKRNGSAKKGKKGKKRSEVPVPVPLVKIPSRYPQEHLPFPVTAEDHPQDPSQDNSTKSMEMRMHTARARDGGRTQSGGVKGVITEN